MTIKVFLTPCGTKIVQAAGDFKVNSTYLLTGGYYSGCMLQLKHISPHKQIMLLGKRHRQVSGVLVGSEGTRVNAVLAHLQ